MPTVRLKLSIERFHIKGDNHYTTKHIYQWNNNEINNFWLVAASNFQLICISNLLSIDKNLIGRFEHFEAVFFAYYFMLVLRQLHKQNFVFWCGIFEIGFHVFFPKMNQCGFLLHFLSKLTNCILRRFRVKEFFFTKQQSF